VRALLARYPGLATAIRRIDLGVGETPLERWRIDDVPLLIKRDDLTSPVLGGNKVRVLELLLAAVEPGSTLLTVGATGSTHALAVAEFGRTLGATTQVITWPQETHAVAGATARRLEETARVTPARSVADAYLRAFARRLRGAGRIQWIPAGGSVPQGALGQASAGLELAAQLERDGSAPPDTLVVPLGSGGTAAGLLVGLALAGLPTRVVGVQVVPRIVANHRRVAGLAQRTHALLSRLLGAPLPPLDVTRLSIERGAYGGAYGRETRHATEAAELLRLAGGPRLDGTYSAKAFFVALARARRSPDERVLFWLTFDGRWLTEQPVG
jgi:1-aminocyclopropane-1-carboxylate deaminase/D-cysteine desulfhydrase-like pyridoxal-dependent ACC family enzyme